MLARDAARIDCERPVHYERRRPEQTVLCQTLQQHLETFIADVEAGGERILPRCARVQGFSLHADVAVPARDRKRLERLLRYVARPPVATERLHRRPDGKLLYVFRKPWRDGTRGVVLTPSELIEKLVALIPPPQANVLRYHGVLAPGSKLRARVVSDRRASTGHETSAVMGPGAARRQLLRRSSL